MTNEEVNILGERLYHLIDCNQLSDCHDLLIRSDLTDHIIDKLFHEFTFNSNEDISERLKVAIKRKLHASTTSISYTIISDSPVGHFLEFAIHFRGRLKLLNKLKRWWNDRTSNYHIFSLIAVGGTGKSSVVDKFVQGNRATSMGNVLIWSFKENINIDEFINAACKSFTGNLPKDIAGRFDYLCNSLRIQEHQNLIILDGIECIQHIAPKNAFEIGTLKDPRIKNLLLNIADGRMGKTRALVTSQLELTDLQKYIQKGTYYSHKLENINEDAALKLLKAWGIKGTAKQMKALAKSVDNHALTVSVLGSYLNNYHDCKIEESSKFELEKEKGNDQQANKLFKILDGYANKLTPEELDFLAHLSIFPKGIPLAIFEYIINENGGFAGSLSNISMITSIAHTLKIKDLIYSKPENGITIYRAHSFLTNYFRKFLKTDAKEIYQVVCRNLALRLDLKPNHKPIATETLDMYETLIEYTILSERYNYAYQIYWDTMGGNVRENHLYHIVGDYGRAIRVFSYFTIDGTPQTFKKNVQTEHKLEILKYWGLCAAAMGDFGTADSCFTVGLENSIQLHDTSNRVACLRNIGWLALLRGLLPQAKAIFEETLEIINRIDFTDKVIDLTRLTCTSHLGYVYFCLGDISTATQYFTKATELCKEPLFSWTGLCEVDHLYKLGRYKEALIRSMENLNKSIANISPRDKSLSFYYRGITLLPNSLSEAENCLKNMGTWVGKSGHIECIIRYHMLASEIAYSSNKYDLSVFEAEAGLSQAENYGFGFNVIELLLLLCKIQIARRDYNSAQEYAERALTKSIHSNCSYIWGEADSLHFCGVIHLALNQRDLAKQHLSNALTKREKIQHPETDATRKILAELF